MLQREIESRGIRSSSITHFPNVSQKVRPPRMMYINAPLGQTFGAAYEYKKQREIILKMLKYSIEGRAEEIRKINL